jgi:hypothetical protein
MAVSPVYAEGNVILLIDTPEQAWIGAYDAKSGKQAWKVDRPIGFLGSYATRPYTRVRAVPKSSLPALLN